VGIFVLYKQGNEALSFWTLKHADMKYIAEQSRKFVDMGGIKISHAIYPVVYPPTASGWAPVIRFDNKVMLAGRQEVQSFTGSPMQIIRIVISGTTAYYDSTGYTAVLNEDDVLVVNPGNEALQSVVYNADEDQENELLEIWLTSNNGNPAHSMQALSSQKGCLARTKFEAGTSFDIAGSKKENNIILSVLYGKVMANGNHLHYGDVAIFSLENPVHLEFERSTDVFQIEVENQLNHRLR
jgi:redox-sensitive bicupin YhaK (pirin superfamily)